MKRVFANGRYANVTATLALVIAMTGTAWAAVNLPKNSVGSKQIKANAVTSAKVKNGSLNKGDFKANQLPAGPAGPRGATGPQGATGAAGANGATTVVSRFVTGTSPLTATCNAGEQAIAGGGFAGSAGGVGGFIKRSRPNPGAQGGPVTGWAVTAETPAGVPVGLDAFVVCASP